jgi:hypothetical protein
MSPRWNRYASFVGASAVVFLVATLGFHVLARVIVRGQQVPTAFSEATQYMSFWQSCETYAPFLVAALISAALAQVAWSRAWILFVLCMGIFSAMYYLGFMQSEQLMQQRKWTASILTVGMIPVKSRPILVGCLIVALVIGRPKIASSISFSAFVRAILPAVALELLLELASWSAFVSGSVPSMLLDTASRALLPLFAGFRVARAGGSWLFSVLGGMALSLVALVAGAVAQFFEAADWAVFLGFWAIGAAWFSLPFQAAFGLLGAWIFKRLARHGA